MLVWNHTQVSLEEIHFTETCLYYVFTAVCISASPDVTTAVQSPSCPLYIGTMSAFTIDSINTEELSILTKVISYVYPLHQYQLTLHLKCKIYKLTTVPQIFSSLQITQFTNQAWNHQNHPRL